MLYLHDAKAGSTASGKGFRVFRRPLQLQNLLGIDSPPSQLGRSQAGGNLLTVRGRAHCTRLLKISANYGRESGQDLN
jgi:hypothetical protein